QVFVDGVNRIRTRGISGGRQYLGQATGADDVWRVTAPRAFRVIGVNRSALEGSQRILDEPRLVECVRVDRNLDVVLLCDGQTGVYGRGRRAPIFVELESDHSRFDLFDKCGR